MVGLKNNIKHNNKRYNFNKILIQKENLKKVYVKTVTRENQAHSEVGP